VSLPRLSIVVDLEGSAAPEIYAQHSGDEARLLEDLLARPALEREIRDALETGLETLRRRARLIHAGDLGRRAA